MPRRGKLWRQNHFLRTGGHGSRGNGRRIQAETGAVMIHPYDDDRIIAGQATAAKELAEDIPELGRCPDSRKRRRPAQRHLLGSEGNATHSARLRRRTGTRR